MMEITWKANGYACSNTLTWHVGEPIPELPAPGRIISIYADEDEMRLIISMLRKAARDRLVDALMDAVLCGPSQDRGNGR